VSDCRAKILACSSLNYRLPFLRCKEGLLLLIDFPIAQADTLFYFLVQDQTRPCLGKLREGNRPSASSVCKIFSYFVFLRFTVLIRCYLFVF
jgi:hypothetical protein